MNRTPWLVTEPKPRKTQAPRPGGNEANRVSSSEFLDAELSNCAERCERVCHGTAKLTHEFPGHLAYLLQGARICR